MLVDYMNIGIRIKIMRKERNLTQEKLANILGISVTFISRVERGNIKINIERLMQIANILNVSPGYLLTGETIQTKNTLREDFRILLDKCNTNQQRLLYELSKLISNMGFEKQ